MASVIINKKDLKRLGKELLKEVYDILHDEYTLTEFEEIKKVQENFLEELTLNHINTLRKQLKITDKKREKFASLFLDLINNKKSEYVSNLVKDYIDKDVVDTEGIYHTLVSLNLNMEIDEDLYFKTKAFLNIFRVFDVDYIYLEN